MSDASFETERHRDDQPPREDLLDPDEIAAEDALREAERDPIQDEPGDEAEDNFPTSEELPETQGDDVDDAAHLAEDATPRDDLDDDPL